MLAHAALNSSPKSESDGMVPSFIYSEINNTVDLLELAGLSSG